MYDPLTRLCVVRLTQLLELSSVEGLQNLEESSYVSKNIAIEVKERESHDGLCNAQPYCEQKLPKHQVKKLFKNISRKEAPHVFGQQVSEATLEMVIQLIDHLKESASTEGLFRISGNKKRQEELKNILNKHEVLDLDAEDCPYNAHDIAGILKYFFSELPEPLLTKSCFVCYQQLAGKLKEMDSSRRHSRKVDTLRMLFLLLPPLNRLLLKKLIGMLALVAADATNKMTSFNLGVIFAPNIVCTRQPMGCLSDFTENVEPFTDLVKFIIENAEEVFQVPLDFMEDAREYLEKVAQDDDINAEIPITRRYCEQIDVKQFTKEAQENTNQELMLLYSQMVDMPDGPVKREFLQKFKESYPGTPMFVPKSVKEKRKSVDLSSCPSTPVSKSRFGCLASCSVKKAASENFLDMPSFRDNQGVVEKNFGTPGKSEDNILAACNSPKKPTQTPSTPTRMKNMYKRFRRRSVELFSRNGKSSEAEDTPTFKNTQPESGVNHRSQSRLKDFFRSSQRSSEGSWRNLKKSVSTPTLITRRKDSLTLDDLGDEKRKLSYSTDLVADPVDSFSIATQHSGPNSFDRGFVNDAFVDVVDDPQPKAQTPVIRKALCPVVANHEIAIRNEQPKTILSVKEASNTPKILKPRYNIRETSNANKEQTPVKQSKSIVRNLMGKSKLPVLSSKQPCLTDMKKKFQLTEQMKTTGTTKQSRAPFTDAFNGSIEDSDRMKTSSSVHKNKENQIPSS